MNKKQLLLKAARFGKAHKMGVNTIAAMFAVIIICFYIKDCICKMAGFIFAPFRWAAGRITSALSAVARFCKRNSTKIISAECVLVSAGILLLVIFDSNILNNMWGDENTGVFAQEQTGGNDEETDINAAEGDKNNNSGSQNETVEPESGYNNITDAEKIPTDKNLPKYYIGLNRALNTVTVYTYDDNGEYTVPVKAMRCAAGGENTPLGTFTLSDKFKFAPLNYNSYGQYCTRITGVILFHSSTYTALKKDTLSVEDYNLLGETVSHGCVRLTTGDAKWIYDNCSEGTVVTIYDDETNPGPLGKPETIKVPDGTKWDPTDPDENNPWKDSRPVISGAVDRNLYEYDEYDVMEGITAVDTCGNDITEDIEVTGTVDLSMPGIYTITYRVTDAIGRKDEVTVTIRVY